ncbi:uncharacterized protein TM35_000191310 [Trypanosoma theileri]|uniref:Uncharacterized protein n=1 Tax=Trypanosoma theileri TaxID=67003 RepID=A0A1X0NT52_9TRYP|nr:uncharacterized protein TM35_000191310 [Trypanosoma theileri]ORC87887.1 hypothetical protein TM35_000191310 [Trypanosoma theileri]
MPTRTELPSLRPPCPDDSLSTPWSIAVYRDRDSATREALPRISTAGMSTSVSGNRSTYVVLAAENNASVAQSDVDSAGRVKEKIRRLLIQQRKKYRELLKLEDDGFKSILRQAEHSVKSITAFMEFRRKKEESEERRRKLILPWVVESFSLRIERLIQVEQEQRQTIIQNERRVRKARQRFEWVTGAKMRFERAVEALLHAEECRRKFIQRSEMREAQSIPLLRPFVVVFENLGVLGQCPFVSVQDCPYFCRGEGVCNPHYAYTKKGRVESLAAATTKALLAV